MRHIKILNRSKSFRQSLVAGYCESFLCKLRGLAFRRSLPPDRGLVLADKSESRINSAIHMLGMTFDLTIVWVNSELKVVDVHHARRLRSLIVPRKPARYVIECAASRYEDFHIGDQLAFEDA